MALPISPAASNAVRWTRITQTLAQPISCIVAVTAVTAILYAVHLHDRPLFPTLAFLFLILIVSAVWGFRYAVFVSFLAMFGFTWLLPPVGQFWVDDPRNWFALASFLVIGIIASHHLERARRETLSAKQRRAEAVAANQVARRSEKELRDVIDTMPVMAWTTLPDGSNIFVNKGWTEYTGLSVEDSKGPGWQTAAQPEDLDRYLEKWRASLASGQPFESEVRLRRAADGEYRWFLARAVPLRDERGNSLKWYGMLTDIEDRKQAEALLAGEKRILEMVAKGDSLPRILDSLCRLVEDHTKDALTAILLVEDGRLWHVGKPSLPRDYVEAIDAIISVQPTVGSCGPSAYFARQVIVSDIMSNPLFDGLRNLALPLYRAVWSTPIMSSEGKVIGTFAMYYREPRSPSPHDQEIIGQITHLAGVAIQRARLDHALAEREAKIRRLVDANIIGIYIWNFEGDILDTNDAFLRMVGYDREDVASGRLRWTELTPAEWRDNDARAVAELKMTGILQPFEKEYFRKDGNRVPVLIGLAAFEENGNEGVAFVLDLTERKLAEEELRASEELKRRIIESSRDCIKALDLDGNLLFMSSGGQQLLEIDNIQPYLNSCWINFWQPEDRPRISEAVAAARAGGIGQFQAFCPSAKGAPRWWDVVTTPICNADGQPEQLLSVSRDITERKRAEEEARESERRYREVQMELAHANRVATMGQLTASIAHEVNQPVAATMTNAQAALRFLAGQTADLDEVRQILNDIVKDGKRAGEVIGRIRDLIKKAPPRRDRWEINGAIHEVIELTRGEAVKNSISVQTELADGLLLIRGDRVQLQQVILNLIINAVEAMSGPGDGPRELLISSGTAESGGVLVTMRDSGPGLAPATLERVFESFYTTKPGGLGLGLSICRSIVEAHGGRLWASANVPGGAVFQFTVPAVEGM